jgi:glycosyltransferase involved in cell wall biosynthesis
LLIGLDVRPSQSQEGFHRGLGEYGRNLVKHLLSEISPHKYILFSDKRDWFSHLSLYKNIEIFYLRRFRRLVSIQDNILLPFEILSKKIDLFHAFDQTNLFLKPTKIVISVHDLIPFIFSKQYIHSNRSKLLYHSKLRFLHRANRIIAISNHTKKDLIRLIGISEEKIKVIYYGLNSIYKSPVKEEEWFRLKDELKINKDYILYVGAFDARKNIPFLISAFKIIKQYTDTLLILAGEYSKKDFYIFNLVKELGLEKDVVFTGLLEPERLRVLYKFAKVLAFPSLYEGFGLPFIEAMACGCPVVAFNCSSAPEIISDAGILVEPQNKDEFIKATISLIENKSLRDKLVEKGFQRAEYFSWQRAAQQTLETYEEVLNE